MSDEIRLTGRDLAIYDNLPPEWVTERDEALASSRALTACANDADARKIGANVKQLKTLAKVVNTERMNITRRLDAFKKELIERERAICKEIADEAERLAKLGTAYATAKAEAEAAKRREEELELLRRQQEEAAEAAIAGREQAPIVEPPAEPERKSPLVAGVRTRTVVTFVVEDANAVPRAYCSPDEKLIREYIQSVKDNDPKWDVGSFSIPGVKFAKEVRV